VLGRSRAARRGSIRNASKDIGRVGTIGFHGEAVTSIFKKIGRLPLHIRSQGFGRVVVYFAVKAGIPVGPARRVVRFLKICFHPIEFIRRRSIGDLRRRIGARIPHGADYLANPPLPGKEALIAHCRGLLERKRASLSYSIPYTFVTTISSQNGIQRVDAPEEMKPIIDFACRPEVAGIVADYMGEIPVLSVISLIYTPTNSSMLGPQNFHRDMNCASQVHLIVNIDDVDEETGPFTFLSGDQSSRIIKTIGHSDGRVTDEAIRAQISDGDLIKCVGQSGAAFFVNPYACFHYGARAHAKPRYILILNYTSKFEWGEGLGSIYRSANRGLFDDGTPLRQRLLALPS
jgi:hypothetical protein